MQTMISKSSFFGIIYGCFSCQHHRRRRCPPNLLRLIVFPPAQMTLPVEFWIGFWFKKISVYLSGSQVSELLHWLTTNINPPHRWVSFFQTTLVLLLVNHSNIIHFPPYSSDELWRSYRSRNDQTRGTTRDNLLWKGGLLLLLSCPSEHT